VLSGGLGHFLFSSRAARAVLAHPLAHAGQRFHPAGIHGFGDVFVNEASHRGGNLPRQVIAEVFHTDIQKDELEELSRIAKEVAR